MDSSDCLTAELSEKACNRSRFGGFGFGFLNVAKKAYINFIISFTNQDTSSLAFENYYLSHVLFSCNLIFFLKTSFPFFAFSSPSLLMSFDSSRSSACLSLITPFDSSRSSALLCSSATLLFSQISW